MTDFFDGGIKSISFGKVRDNTMFNVWQGGKVLKVGTERQCTNLNTGELQTWQPSGDPMMQVPITLDTKAGKFPAAALGEDDDLIRDLYLTKGKGQFRAVMAALRAERVKGAPEPGGELYIRWISGVGEIGDARVFEAIYTPPIPGAGGMFDAPAAPPAQPSTQAPQMPAQPPAQPRFDPNTGQPIAPPAPPTAPAPRFDPNTGQPIQQTQPPVQRFDPNTGQPIAQDPGNPFAGRQ